MEPGLFGENKVKKHHVSIMDSKVELKRLKSQGYEMYRGGIKMTDEHFDEWCSW